MIPNGCLRLTFVSLLFPEFCESFIDEERNPKVSLQIAVDYDFPISRSRLGFAKRTDVFRSHEDD
jgi:hypothetical protein